MSTSPEIAISVILSTQMFVALSPILLLSFGIVLSLLLIAWQRSQKMIALFTQFILFSTLLLTLQLLSGDLLVGSGTQITTLLRVDRFSYLSFVLICFSAIVVVSLSRSVLKSEVEVHDEYYLLILLVVLGAGILVVSDHFASLFLGFELLSISLVGLVGYFREHKYAVETGFKYLILSATASSFMLLGIAFIYSQTGNLSFAVSSNAMPFSEQPVQIFHSVGILLLFSGIAFKLSLAPFHFWSPDVYQGSPTPITLLMATVSKVAMFTVLIKCCFSQNYFTNESFIEIITAVALLSMLVGNILALRQQKIKRLMAYSSIAHFGYLLIVLTVSSLENTDFAWQSALFYLFAYLLANIAIFTVLLIFEKNRSNVDRDKDIHIIDWQGMFWKNRLSAVLIIFSILGLAGIPLTMGFIGKFYLLNQAVLFKSWWLISGLVIGSGIGLAYYLPVIFTLFKNERVIENQSVDVSGVHLVTTGKQLFLFTLLIITLLLGVFPDLVSQFIYR
jgi:NADH-quinone oxidoreductase subunit N